MVDDKWLIAHSCRVRGCTNFVMNGYTVCPDHHEQSEPLPQDWAARKLELDKDPNVWSIER